jgi:hypothetical protein
MDRTLFQEHKIPPGSKRTRAPPKQWPEDKDSEDIVKAIRTAKDVILANKDEDTVLNTAEDAVLRDGKFHDTVFKKFGSIDRFEDVGRRYIYMYMIYVCIRIHMYVCMCIYIYIYVYRYVYICICICT